MAAPQATIETVWRGRAPPLGPVGGGGLPPAFRRHRRTRQERQVEQ